MGIEFGKMDDLGGMSSKRNEKHEVVLGVNGVAMDRHGLILWENEATGSRKVFRCLMSPAAVSWNHFFTVLFGIAPNMSDPHFLEICWNPLFPQKTVEWFHGPIF